MSVTVVIKSDSQTVIRNPKVLVVGSSTAGPQGTAGVYASPTAPTNTALIWVDTTGL